MTDPTWLAASSGQLGEAGQINQFLVSHDTLVLYTGNEGSSQNTPGSGSTDSNGLWMAQEFATGSTQTKLGRVQPTFTVTGAPDPLMLHLRQTLTGPDLATTFVPHELFSASSSASVPLPAAVSPSTNYWIVAEAVGDASNFYAWSRSNQTSGASTSPDGTAWTSQAYGFLYFTFDQGVVGTTAHTYEDDGDRWTTISIVSGQLTVYAEFTQGQTVSGYAASVVDAQYGSGELISIVSA